MLQGLQTGGAIYAPARATLVGSSSSKANVVGVDASCSSRATKRNNALAPALIPAAREKEDDVEV